MTNSKIIFTTSWDDGHVLDLRLADLLDRYGIKGTFYIARETKDRLSENDIKNIAARHEIGAHTITHRNLNEISITEAGQEINESKEWLEGVVGSAPKVFCYPRGSYNEEVKKIVQAAGFVGARTVERNIGSGGDNFALPVTLQVYPFPWRMRDSRRLHLSRHLWEPLFGHRSQIKNLSLPMTSWLNWNALAENILLSPNNGSYFHLWGHSWEIEKYDLWEKLEKFLQFAANRKEIIFLTNSETVEYYENFNS